MCESNAYIITKGREELILEDVEEMEQEGEELKLRNIFGEERSLKARIKRFSLVEHKIILEPIS